jgi:DNA-binding winged helix-turn-helix (wHTH) protein
MKMAGSQFSGREGESRVPTASRWRLSDLLLDTRRQRVWRDSREIPLPKLTYDLLVTLARCHPTVISDEDLMRHVWPGLVVSQETVSQRVKLLREALGDDARNPRYIARLRSRGYHLVGMVECLSDEGESPAPAHAAEADAPLTTEEELTLLEPEWRPGDCDRPEWAVTQVIARGFTPDVFSSLVAAVDPAAANSPGLQGPVIGEQYHRLDQCLRDQDPVESIRIRGEKD